MNSLTGPQFKAQLESCDTQRSGAPFWPKRPSQALAALIGWEFRVPLFSRSASFSVDYYCAWFLLGEVWSMWLSHVAWALARVYIFDRRNLHGPTRQWRETETWWRTLLDGRYTFDGNRYSTLRYACIWGTFTVAVAIMHASIAITSRSG